MTLVPSMCCRGRTAREEGAADRGDAAGEDDDGMMHIADNASR